MNDVLRGKTIAIVATDGVAQSELAETRAALDDAGAETHLIAPKAGLIRSWEQDHYGGNFVVDAELKNARPADYDALVLPGGVLNADKLRALPLAVDFVRALFETGKPLAAIGHGAEILIEADIVRGKKLTSYPSRQTDLINAGADWLDVPVMSDHNLITARRTEDLAAFKNKIIQEFAAVSSGAAAPADAESAQPLQST